MVSSPVRSGQLRQDLLHDQQMDQQALEKYEFVNPISLKELCLDTICDNFAQVFDKIDTGGFAVTGGSDAEPSLKPEPKVRYRFKDSDCFLVNELSEQLLCRLSDLGFLDDETMSLFCGRNTQLKNVKIRPRCKDYTLDLSILQEHNIANLNCSYISDIPKVIRSLGAHNLAQLRSLNVSRCSFIDSSRHQLTVCLSQLRNLRRLNVAFSGFNQAALQLVCEDLYHLESLDISGTWVTDLRPLLLVKDRLTQLYVVDVHLDDMPSIVTQLYELRLLDMHLSLEYEGPRSVNCEAVIASVDCLPHLRYLDISSRTVRAIYDSEMGSKPMLENYVRAHPQLGYLGLYNHEFAGHAMFVDEKAEGYVGDDIVVAGLANEKQIVVLLQRYRHWRIYMQKTLYHLFQLTRTFSTARGDILALVIPPMRDYETIYGVQVAATACIYNLTRGELSKRIHPCLLSQAVALTLRAMEMFREEYQLHKNALLTLCSDRILQEVRFDRFRCAQLALSSLCTFDDVHMNRMAVAICSILAAKVSTAETSQLGSQPEYMKKLLMIVDSRVQRQQSDITMKFTLSALWNLSDESAATCRVFLDLGGAQLFLQVLRVFRGDSQIETKVLGLLNNIAEVQHLRSHLLVHDYVEKLNELLQSQYIDVSYFAAGIVAHLASDGDTIWDTSITSSLFTTARTSPTSPSSPSPPEPQPQPSPPPSHSNSGVAPTNGVASPLHTRTHMLYALERSVLGWLVPDTEMVSYRSFRPFFPLLKVDADHRVQLWAVWAIHHVCTKNPKRYCQMLREECGVRLLEDIVFYDGANELIKTISNQILNAVNSHI